MGITIQDSDLHLLRNPSGIELQHAIEGVKGSFGPVQVRAGYYQVDNGNRLEPVWDIQVSTFS